VSTGGASDPTFRLTPEVVELNALRSVDLDEVTLLISSLSNKQCRSDPLLTWLLKECTAELAPFICRLFNASLWSGRVPQSFKSAYITPLLKKVSLDNTDTKNYQPISNLSVTSKMLERVILRRQLEHLKVNGLFPSVLSAYRKCHSTETAMARVLSDILMALDRGDVAALALLACLLHSTWSITTFYCAVSVNHTASAAWRSLGSVCTWLIVSSLSVILECSQRRSPSSLVCRRAPPSGPCYLFCTPPISCR